ncbi:MAG: TonB family protein [Cyclobacteriaceae bacterium]
MMRWIVSLLVIAFCCDARYVPEDGVYAVAEVMPEYSEGMSIFAKYIKSETASLDSAYPGKIVGGKVMVSFVVHRDGTVAEIKVLRGINELQDQTALMAIQNAPKKWTPGTNQGKPVDVKLVYPVVY